jgi:demethoxyubiquinone hydroxylase (CLK1/Coq7/Cat5 family)
MNGVLAHRLLGELLQKAYSGELAAAFAYRGHWKSLKHEAEITRIQQIEEEEWIHRRNIRRMLWFLDFCPSRIRELKSWIVGRCIGLGCHILGWFWPMYFAGRLESANTKEYEKAASYARDLGLLEFETELLNMSAVEKEHELYFLGVVSAHRLLPFAARTFKWGQTAPEPGESARSGKYK